MSVKKFIFSGIICTLIFVAVDLSWHLLFFKAAYLNAGQKPAQHFSSYAIWIINDLYRGFLFALVYTIFVRKHHSLFRGLLFGACVGLLLSSVSGMYYTALKIDSLQWLWLEGLSLLIQCVIAGILVPVICWRNKKPQIDSTQP